MALKDILALVDDKLHDVFHQKPHDPTRARKPFLSGLKKARKQFDDNKMPRGSTKWFAVSNSVVAFTPNLNGNPVKIGGKDTLYIPSERFPDFLTGLEASCHAGELDDQFKDGPIGVGNGRRNSGAGTSPLKGREWTPARRAAFEARKKAK